MMRKTIERGKTMVGDVDWSMKAWIYRGVFDGPKSGTHLFEEDKSQDVLFAQLM